MFIKYISRKARVDSVRVNNFTIKKDTLLLEVKNIEFDSKGIYVINGKNGTGKTIFFEMILKEKSRLDEIDKQTNIAYSSQQLYRYSMSGRQYVRTSNIQLLNEYCKYFDVDYLERNILDLSGGEFVKLAIIRCLVKDSPIVILDEPTNNLDDSTAEKVQDILNKLAKAKTIIVSTHDERLKLDHHTEYLFDKQKIFKREIKEQISEKMDYRKSIPVKEKLFKNIFFSKFNKYIFSLLFILFIGISIISVGNILSSVFLGSKLADNNHIELLDVHEPYNRYMEAISTKVNLNFEGDFNYLDIKELINLSETEFVEGLFVIDSGYLQFLNDRVDSSGKEMAIFSIPNMITNSPNYQKPYPGCKEFTIMGRLPKDDAFEVILSYDQIQRHWNYEGDINNMIGQEISINNIMYKVVGITNLPIITISFDENSTIHYGVFKVNSDSENDLHKGLNLLAQSGYAENDLYYRNIFIKYREGYNQDVMAYLVEHAPSYQYYSNYVNGIIMMYTYKEIAKNIFLVSLLLSVTACVFIFVVGKKSFIIIDDYIRDVDNINFCPNKNRARLYAAIGLDFLIILPIMLIASFMYLRSIMGLLLMLPFFIICVLSFVITIYILKRRIDKSV